MSETQATENQASGKTRPQSVKKKVTQFLRPDYIEPRHTVLSSPFAKRLMIEAAGPVKPTWYKAPSFWQFRTFKAIVALIEVGREWPISLKHLTDLLQELAPSVTALEVLHILDRLQDTADGNEIDFGEFIFLLVNNPFYSEKLKEPRCQDYIAKHLFSPRQRVFYSGLAYYCLIQTEDNITRFYREKTQQHFDVLRYHMAAARNEGLSELQMEKKQAEARGLVRKLFKKEERSPYTAPVPFVPATAHEEHYAKYRERQKSLPKTLLPKPEKKATHRIIKPLKMKREIGDPVSYEDEEDYLIHLFKMGQLPRPDMRVPARKLKEMRTAIREDEKAYLEVLKAKAMKLYYDRLKYAAVAFSKRCLKTQLKKGFPDESSKIDYFSMFRRMMPLSVDDSFIIHPWAVPSIDKHNSSKPKFNRPPFEKSATI